MKRIYGSLLVESTMLALQDWVRPEQMIKTLSKSKNDKVFGDVNVRFCTEKHSRAGIWRQRKIG
jgi:hypothetical protein